MLVLHIFMILAGLFGLGWGFWAAHNARKPLDIIGSLTVIAGFIVALLGTLLVCVPGFFSS